MTGWAAEAGAASDSKGRGRAAADDGGGLSTKRCEHHVKRKGEDFEQTPAALIVRPCPTEDRGERIADMKHQLLTGVAVAAALAFSAPVWAQTSPSGGNSMGTPGPNPGGPGLTPYSTGPNPGGSALSGPRTTAAPPPSAPPAAMAPSAMPPESSATSPSYRHTRAYYHHKKMATYHHETAKYHRGKAYATGGTANQLNQEELARLQSGNMSMPPAPASAPGMMPPGQPGGAHMTTHGTVQ